MVCEDPPLWCYCCSGTISSLSLSGFIAGLSLKYSSACQIGLFSAPRFSPLEFWNSTLKVLPRLHWNTTNEGFGTQWVEYWKAQSCSCSPLPEKHRLLLQTPQRQFLYVSLSPSKLLIRLSSMKVEDALGFLGFGWRSMDLSSPNVEKRDLISSSVTSSLKFPVQLRRDPECWSEIWEKPKEYQRRGFFGLRDSAFCSIGFLIQN